MSGMTERRRDGRVAAFFPVRVRVGSTRNPEFLEGRAVDVSASGVRVRLPARVPVRAGLIVELRMPGGAPIRSLGRAAWIRPLAPGGGYEVGSPFVEQTTAARLAIGRFLDRPAA